MLETKQAVKRVELLHDRLRNRRPEITKNMNYFRGEQPLMFASKEWANIHKSRYRGFSDNWCGVVGSAPAERTELFGFQLPSDGKPDSPAALVSSAEEKLLWRDWETNEGPAQSSQGFLESTVAKRSFLLVWGTDDSEPELTWESPSQMIVDVDPAHPNRPPRYALKAWVDDDVEYATLYEPEAVWKFKRPSSGNYTVKDGRTESGIYLPNTSFTPNGGGWKARDVEETGDDQWPLGNPLGVVPVVEYENRPMLAAEPMSDIHGTIAMQDAINLLWAYMFVAADHASMPARVVMGQAPPKLPILDEAGQKIGERVVDIEELTKGRMLWLTGQTTTISQWDSAKLDVFTDVVKVAVQHVSAQSRTPIYLVHGELGNVNGETLTGLDAPLVSKVQESHKFYRSPARRTFSLMARVRGLDQLAQACLYGTPLWKNPGVRSDSQISDAAVKDKEIGWPFAAILAKRYGLSQPEIDTILEQVKAEQADPYLSLLDKKDEGDDADDRSDAPPVGA